MFTFLVTFTHRSIRALNSRTTKASKYIFNLGHPEIKVTPGVVMTYGFLITSSALRPQEEASSTHTIT